MQNEPNFNEIVALFKAIRILNEEPNKTPEFNLIIARINLLVNEKMQRNFNPYGPFGQLNNELPLLQQWQVAYQQYLEDINNNVIV